MKTNEEKKKKAMDLISMGASLQAAADGAGCSKSQVGKWKLQVFGRAPERPEPKHRRLEGLCPNMAKAIKMNWTQGMKP